MDHWWRVFDVGGAQELEELLRTKKLRKKEAGVGFQRFAQVQIARGMRMRGDLVDITSQMQRQVSALAAMQAEFAAVKASLNNASSRQETRSNDIDGRIQSAARGQRYNGASSASLSVSYNNSPRRRSSSARPLNGSDREELSQLWRTERHLSTLSDSAESSLRVSSCCRFDFSNET
jgi:hypothetical protein